MEQSLAAHAAWLKFLHRKPQIPSRDFQRKAASEQQFCRSPWLSQVREAGRRNGAKVPEPAKLLVAQEFQIAGTRVRPKGWPRKHLSLLFR
jgi:hypothetical protein